MELHLVCVRSDPGSPGGRHWPPHSFTDIASWRGHRRDASRLCRELHDAPALTSIFRSMERCRIDCASLHSRFVLAGDAPNLHGTAFRCPRVGNDLWSGTWWRSLEIRFECSYHCRRRCVTFFVYSCVLVSPRIEGVARNEEEGTRYQSGGD